MLRQSHGANDTDFRAQQWNTFTLNPGVDSQTVTFTVTSVYEPGRMGLIEIELYSTGNYDTHLRLGWGAEVTLYNTPEVIP